MSNSVRTNIRLGIEHGLAQITQTNGYRLTVGDKEMLKSSEDFGLNYPVVNVDIGEEIYRSIDGGHTLGYLPKRLLVNFEFTVKDIENVRPEEMKAIADTEQYFLNYSWIPLESGAGTVAGEVMFNGTSVVGLEEHLPYGKVVLPLYIDYLQSQFDPSSMNMSTSVPAYDGSLPQSVDISRRDALRLAVIFNLRKIKKSSGYSSTLIVNEQILSAEKLKKFPAANVSVLPDNYLNFDNFTFHDGLIHKTMDYQIDIYLNSTTATLLDAETMLADIEKCIMNLFTLPDEDGKRTCVECMFTANNFIGVTEDEPHFLLRVGLRCFYRQLIANPAGPVHP